jgi:hypothetical protein
MVQVPRQIAKPATVFAVRIGPLAYLVSPWRHILALQILASVVRAGMHPVGDVGAGILVALRRSQLFVALQQVTPRSRILVWLRLPLRALPSTLPRLRLTT